MWFCWVGREGENDCRGGDGWGCDGNIVRSVHIARGRIVLDIVVDSGGDDGGGGRGGLWCLRGHCMLCCCVAECLARRGILEAAASNRIGRKWL